MRKTISIGIAATVAALFTHGLVFSAVYFKDDPLPLWTYQGFFQRILLATERLWSHAHGWPPLSHIRDFGRFYAPVIQLLTPLIGLALFCLLSRRNLGRDLLKPVAITLLLVIPSRDIAAAPFSAIGLGEPWAQVLRTLLVLSLMVWSIGAIRTAPRRL